MGLTKFTEFRAPQSRAYIGGDLPTTPYLYYGTVVTDVDSKEWRGGEIAINTRDNRVYIQTATSGVTPTWKRYLLQLTAV